MTRQFIIATFASFLAAMLCGVGEMHADDFSTKDRIEFYRSEVPSSRIAEVTGDHRIMKREGFERLVEQGRLSANGSQQRASIRRATYRARLGDGEVLEGTAQLDITSAGDQPNMLALSPLGVVVGQCAWEDGSTPARLGRTRNNAAAIVVEGEALLNFDWSLRPAQDRDSGIEFNFQLPKAVATTLFLELPQKYQPMSDRGVVTLVESDTGMMSEERVWRIELGAAAQGFPLRLVVTQENSSKLVFLTQNQQCNVGRHAMDLVADMYLDVYGTPLDRLQLRVSNELTVRDVTYSNRRAKWEAIHSDDKTTLYEVKLHTDLIGTGQLVRVACRAPTVVDRPWRLPAVTVGNAFWRDGKTLLVVSNSLELLDLQATGSRIRSSEKSPAAVNYDIEAFSTKADIQLHVAYQLPHLVSRVGTSTVLQESSYSSKTIASLSAASGEIFEFECVVPASWNRTEIPITFTPESMVSSFQLEDRPASSAGRKLVVRLEQPLTKDRSLTIEASGIRRQLGRKVASEMLPLLAFAPIHDIRRYLWLRAPRRTRVEVSNDHDVQRLAVEEISEQDRGLTDAPANAFVYVLAADQSFNITAKQSDASFAGSIRYSVLAGSDAVRETIAATCVPIAGELDSFYVHLLQDKDTPIDWLSERDLGQITARKLTSEEQQTLALGGGDSWKIDLGVPQTSAFTIVGTRDVPSDGDFPLSFPALLGAESQRGVLVVDSTQHRVMVESDDLRPLTPASRQATSQEFGYDADTFPTASLRLRTHDAAKVIVWSCKLHSTFETGGRAVHTADFRVENFGASHVELTMPPASKLIATHVNGDRNGHPHAQQKPYPLRIPTRSRWVDISVRFETPEETLGWISRLEPSFPRINSHPASGLWTVEFPPDCEVLLPHTQRIRRDDGGLMYRLFGPFARVTEPLPGTVGRMGDGPATSRFVDAGTPSIVTLVCRTQTTALAWSAFVLACSIFWWLGARTMRWALFAAPVVLLTTLLVPEPFVPITALTLAGYLLGTLFVLLPRKRHAGSVTLQPDLVHAAGALVLAYFICSLPPSSSADEVVTNRKTSAPYEVLVPVIKVDGKSVPQDSYYLPEALYAKLRRLQQPHSAADEPLITDAMYDVQLVAGATEDTFELAPVRATFSVYLPMAPRIVRIPFRKSEMNVVDARVDGRQIPFRWTNANDALEFELQEEGEIEVTIEFSPVEATVREQQLALKIPSIPSSRILASVPDEAPKLEFPESLGAITNDADRRTYNVQHGPASQLIVDWSGSKSAVAQPNDPLHQLTWITIEPGAVFVDLQLIYPPQPNTFQSVDIDVDPRLRVIRAVVNEKVSETLVTSMGKRNRVAISLDESLDAAADGLMLNVSFLVTEASGVGNLLIPQIAPAKEVAAKRWLGVSIAGELELDTSFSDDVDFLTPREFLETWGESDETLKLAVDLTASEVSGTIKTLFKPMQLTIDEQVQLTASNRLAHVSYAAAIEIREGQLGQLRWFVPLACTVDSIEIQQGERKIAAWWTRASDGQVIASVAQPLRESFVVKLAARVQLPRGTAKLPTIWLSDAASRTHRIDVYQTNSARVTVKCDSPACKSLNVRDIRAVVSPQAMPATSFLLSDYSAIEASRLVAKQNRTVVRGMSLTTLERKDARWSSSFTFTSEAVQGRLDFVQLRCPVAWGDEFTVSDGFQIEVGDAAGQSTRSILVRKQQRTSIQGPFQFTITAVHTPDDEEFNLLPTITTPNFEAVQQFVALPRKLGSQDVTWNHNGLRQAVIPPRLASQVNLPQFVGYRTTKDSYRATLQQDVEQTEQPQISLIDYQLQATGYTTWQGCATLTILNPPTPRCVLRVPSHIEVTDVLVDSKIVPIECSDGQLTIELGRQRLPTTCEILFRAVGRGHSMTEQTVSLFEVVDISVARTILSVANPSNAYQWRPQGAACSTHRRYELQLANIANTIEYAMGDELAVSKEMRERWYAYWIELYAGTRRRWLLQRSLLSTDRETLVRELDNSQMQLADKLGLRTTCQAAIGKAQDGRGNPTRRLQEGAGVLAIAHEGALAQVSLDRVSKQVRAVATEDWLSRSVIFLLGCCSCLLIRRQHIMDGVQRFGFGLLLAFGLFWIAFLTPSLVGVIIVGASISLAFLPRFGLGASQR